MKLQLRQGRLESLLKQRNLLLLSTFLLLAINLLQSCVTLLSSQRIIVMPPQMTRGVWVEKNRVSPSYIEEMTLFLAQLFLEVSPESVSFKRDLILRHAAPSGYGALKRRLLEDAKRLQKERVVTSFQPSSIKISGMKAEITGDLARYVGEKRISQTRDTYAFSFVFREGRLLVQSFEWVKSHG